MRLGDFWSRTQHLIPSRIDDINSCVFVFYCCFWPPGEKGTGTNKSHHHPPPLPPMDWCGCLTTTVSMITINSLYLLYPIGCIPYHRAVSAAAVGFEVLLPTRYVAMYGCLWFILTSTCIVLHMLPLTCCLSYGRMSHGTAVLYDVDCCCRLRCCWRFRSRLRQVIIWTWHSYTGMRVFYI